MGYRVEGFRFLGLGLGVLGFWVLALGFSVFRD